MEDKTKLRGINQEIHSSSELSMTLRPAWRLSPWLFIPILYVMQAMPTTIVQEVFTITYKDLHVANATIVAWTSIIALPWALKLFWGPLVDLNFTKRRWTLGMELLITAALCCLAWGVMLPQYGGGHVQAGFRITLGLLLIMAIFSATHDIACDGLYILSLTKKQQAAYVGIQGSCYRLGRLLCVGGLVFLAGELEKRGVGNARSWMIVLAIAAVLYGLGTIYNFFMLPAPDIDAPAKQKPGEKRGDIARTIIVVSLGISIVLLIDGGIHLIGGFIFNAINPPGATGAAIKLPQWKQTPADMIHFAWLVGVGVALFIAMSLAMRKTMRGTVMAESFLTFVRQPGFWAIFLFVMFYRFGEAMVTKVLPLFLKDPVSHHGLNVSTADVGLIVGTAGVIGIIFGGIIGGLVVARLGLKKSFWPLAIAMHAPNLFFLFIALGYRSFANPAGWPNYFFHNWLLYLAAFVQEFGYGFGFAAYSLFLMNVAQRSHFQAAHYAFGTGLGALCIIAAGILSAVLVASVTYTWFFAAVCILTIPGMITLLIIPLGNE